MASPPYSHSLGSASSPPYSSNAQPPHAQKRRQTDMPSTGPSSKRRKASMMSVNSAASAHPLRQTSFPPESSEYQKFSRSPSVDMSVVSEATNNNPATKKKRAKKSRGANDNESTHGGGTKSVYSETSGRVKQRGSRGMSAEDEEDEEGDEDETNIETIARTHEERQKEIEHRALLVNALDEKQFSRYEAWRSSKLSDAVVRRIVNQTLSQSAPASVILAVRSVAKMFAGDIIEGARRVQTQWVEVDDESQTGLPSPPADPAKPGEAPPVKKKETRRGPLLPDHLREAMRRQKMAGEGNMAGQLGLWQHQQSSGVERFGSKVRGKRLMK